MSKTPKVNDNEHDLLVKLVINSALIADNLQGIEIPPDEPPVEL